MKSTHFPIRHLVSLLFFWAFFLFCADSIAISAEAEKGLVGFSQPQFQREIGNFTFQKSIDGWQAESRTQLSCVNDSLLVESGSAGAALYHLFDSPCSKIKLRLKIKTPNQSQLNVYWLTKEFPRRDASRMCTLYLTADDQFHDYELFVPASGHLTFLSFQLLGTNTSAQSGAVSDAGSSALPSNTSNSSSSGLWYFDAIEVSATVPFPLVVKKAVRDEKGVKYTISNTGQIPIDFTAAEIPGDQRLEAGREITLTVPIKTSGHLAIVSLKLTTKDFPYVEYPIFIYLPDGKTDWITHQFPDSNFHFEISPSAQIARIVRKPDNQQSEVVAIIAPLVHQNGVIPDFKLISTPDSAPNLASNSGPTSDENSEAAKPADNGNDTAATTNSNPNVFRFVDSKTEATKTDPPDTKTELVIELLPNGEVGFKFTAPKGSVFEGPVVRPFGTLQGGLLSGVELLGPNDVSSSNIDVTEPNNQRFEPPVNWITMPLGVVATDKVSTSLMWLDMTLQPTFAVPNFTDLSDDYRMSLKGNEISASVRFSEPARNSVSEAIRYAVIKRGIPDLPIAPRTPEDQKAITLYALENALLGPDKISWGYSAEPGTPREPYADVLSTLYRLTGKMPKMAAIVPDGSVLPNDSIYFLASRVQEWKEVRGADVEAALEEMKPDGSFPKRSKFMEIDYEFKQTTSFGYCARKAAFLLDYARITGDRKVVQRAAKTLKYLQSYEVPRGGYYWDSTFHTPDILAAAYATWAFTRGFELTGNDEYLEEAKRFALLGLPFVYQWGDKPIMLYTTIPMFGATSRETPWFGTVQPWAGVIYGYAVTLLAKHDQSFDWKKIATGILTAAEQTQYPDGTFAGCLPDAFALDSQMRYSLKLNPCGLVSLRRAIEGEVDSLAVITDAGSVVASPFLVVPNKKGAIVRGVPAGQTFEILIDGQRIESVEGSGNNRDQISY
ncbi:MAG: hypothetical protein ACRC2T_04305 [Thermoguttaceae bacterium]